MVDGTCVARHPRTFERSLLRLGKAETSIGRGEEADFQLAVQGVSRLHLKIGLQGGTVTATDLGSRNGSLLNDEPLDGSAEINPGDRLTLGTTVLALCDPDAQGEVRLQAVKGNHAAREFPLTGDRVTIGRSRNATIPIADASASREHTILERAMMAGM